MKTKRFLLAAAIAMALAACSTDLTGPQPASFAPAAPSSSTAPATTTEEADVEDPAPTVAGGLVGSGG